MHYVGRLIAFNMPLSAKSRSCDMGVGVVGCAARPPMGKHGTDRDPQLGAGATSRPAQPMHNKHRCATRAHSKNREANNCDEACAESDHMTLPPTIKDYVLINFGASVTNMLPLCRIKEHAAVDICCAASSPGRGTTNVPNFELLS